MSVGLRRVGAVKDKLTVNGRLSFRFLEIRKRLVSDM
jgi:hypothetical protein